MWGFLKSHTHPPHFLGCFPHFLGCSPQFLFFNKASGNIHTTVVLNTREHMYSLIRSHGDGVLNRKRLRYLFLKNKL